QTTMCIFDNLEAVRSEFSDEARTTGAGFLVIGFDTGILRRYGSILPQTCDSLFDPTLRGNSVAKSPEPDDSFEAKFRNFLPAFKPSR
ncbi:hypothetical protein AAVH_13863, partial [Aphelenchoides avenae]